MYNNIVHGFCHLRVVSFDLCALLEPIMHALFFWFVLTIITREYNRRGKKMPKFAMKPDCLCSFFSFFLKKQTKQQQTMELRFIHFFCPRRSMSVLCPHDYVMRCSNKGGTRCCLHHKKCNKCFRWITNFNIDPQCRCFFFIPFCILAWKVQLFIKIRG